MALPPDDSNDTFLREVDENLRRDELQEKARKYGGWIIAAVVLFLAAVAGWIYWQQRQKAETAKQSEELSQVYNDIGANKLATVPQRLDRLAEEGDDVVRASALFTRAAVAIEQQDRPLAIAKYREAANDKGLPEPYRDIALIRMTSLEFDSIKPEEVIARMQPLAKAGNPWFGSAGELTAMAYLKQGKNLQAGRLFAAIAADRQVPASIRTRSVQIAGALGVDASAALSTIGQ